MTVGGTDAELVASHLAGDRDALGAIYDRYARSLYDTAAALLGDRDEAADVVQDTFVAAAQHLGQLRDPTRLRAWLFAITRHEVERRGRKRRRAVPTEAVADMAPTVSGDLDAELDRAELAALVRAAAAGLDARDQQILELSMRQGLEGADLAAALGVTPAQSYSLVFRTRERVSRSLGALVVARTGRRDCPELATILSGWDGTFSVLIRKRVARHVDGCEVCHRTKARAALPALMVAAPAFALPAGLRDLALGGTPSATSDPAALRLDDDGFPVAGRGSALPSPRSRWGRRAVAVVGAAAAVAVVAGGVALVMDRGGDPAVEVSAEATDPTVAAPSSLASTTVVTTTAPAVTTAPEVLLPPSTPPTVPPTPPPPPPAELRLSTTSLSLGTTDETALVEVTNRGGQGVAFTVEDVNGPITVDGGGRVGPGEVALVTVALDRASLPEGAVAATFRVASPAGGGVVAVDALVARPPVIRGVTFGAGALRAGGCAPRSTSVMIAVADESAVTVQATSTGPGGRVEQVALSGGNGTWTGRIGPFAVAGAATIDVVAVDALGQQASTTRRLAVMACTT